MALIRDRMNKISRIFIIFIAVFGCSIQLRTTLLSYFNYESISRTIYIAPEIQENMCVSICVSYSDILDYHATKELRDIAQMGRNQRHIKVQDVITVSEIFQYTPKNESIIEYCKLRFESTRIFTSTTNKTLCHQLFRVTKYYTQEYMCYMIVPKRIDIDTYSYTRALDSGRQIYALGISHAFSSMITFIKLIVHNDGLPTWSKQYAPSRYNIKCDKTIYHVGYVRQFLSYLGRPYDWFTCTENENDDDVCIESCIVNQSITRYNRIAYDIDTTNMYEYKHLSMSQVSDPVIAESMDRIVKKCQTICDMMPCNADYTLSSFDTGDNNIMEVVLDTANAPDTLVKYYPSIKILDLLVYVMGAIGAWFGFAFIQIDLMAIYSGLHKLALRLCGEEEENYILWRRVNVGTKGRPNIIHVPVTRLNSSIFT